HNLAGMRPLTMPGSTGGEPSTGRHGPTPAAGPRRFAGSLRTSSVASSPSPHIARVGTASKPRTTAPSPSAIAPAPLPSPPTLPSISSAPAIPPLNTPSISSEPPAGLSAGQPLVMGGDPLRSPGQ